MKRIIYLAVIVSIVIGLESCGPITSSITHTTIASPYSGRIDLNLNYNPVSSYQWYHVNPSSIATSTPMAYTPSLSGLHASNIPFSVITSFYYGGHSYASSPLTQYVLCDVNWQRVGVSNLTTSSNGAIAKVNSSLSNNSSAYSVNTLPANIDGFLEFQVGSARKVFCVGLTPLYTADDPTSVTFGVSFEKIRVRFGNMYFYQYWAVAVNNITHSRVYTRYLAGDVFQILKIGNTISITQNGNPLTTFNSVPSMSLIADIACIDAGSNLTYARTTFTDAFDLKNYASLSKELNSSYVIMQNTVNFKYLEKYYSPALSYKIYDWQRLGVKDQGSVPGISNGVNFATIPPSGLTHLSDGGQYVLEVINSKSEVYQLKFKYKKN